VTVGAAVAGTLALITVVLYAAGTDVSGRRPSLSLTVGQAGIMGLMAYGMWRVRYWAVLGMQALLALLIISFSVYLFLAGSVLTVVICLAVLVPAGALFWFLVRAMARIQMPARR
jgi:hypothetical protein